MVELCRVMSNKIHVLTDRTINQIAAGEVIENPASVVKELVENAIDAGATQVQVELVGGGFHLIRIVDNGFGMSQDNALLSFERHATSKIVDVDDLESLHTMGFRGEALASICSISKMTMLTSDGESGTKVVSEGGAIISVSPCARQRGTTIEVRNLFYNVPARKKFQKSATVSAGEISRAITKVCLGYPEIGFTLASHDRELIRTEGGDFEGRVCDVLGTGFLSGTTWLALNHKGIKIEGFLGLPKSSRSNRSGQYLYINRRCVVSPLIQEAVGEAYSTMIQPKEFPLFVLHISMPGNTLDVNVHPQKKEVRIKDGGELRSMLIEAVGVALNKTYSIPQVEISDLEHSIRFPAMSFKEEAAPGEDMFEEAMLPWEETVPCGIGVFQRYLLVDAATISLLNGEGLALVDLVAASSRIHYEAIMREEKKLEKQNLLFPETVELNPADSEILSQYLEEMDHVGLAMRKFGETTFIVEAIADYYEGQDFLSLISSFLEELRMDSSEKTDKLALRACRFMKKTQGPYQMPEAIAILYELLKCKTPLFCPSGNSTIVKVEQDELQGWFKMQRKGQAFKKADS
jgi:DNA mismatch repair protein MutL